MQDATCDFVKASEHAIALHEVFLHKRDDVLYYDEIWESAITLANQQTMLHCSPRIAGRQQHRNNVSAPSVHLWINGY